MFLPPNSEVEEGDDNRNEGQAEADERNDAKTSHLALRAMTLLRLWHAYVGLIALSFACLRGAVAAILCLRPKPLSRLCVYYFILARTLLVFFPFFFLHACSDALGLDRGYESSLVPSRYLQP